MGGSDGGLRTGSGAHPDPGRTDPEARTDPGRTGSEARTGSGRRRRSGARAGRAAGWVALGAATALVLLAGCTAGSDSSTVSTQGNAGAAAAPGPDSAAKPGDAGRAAESADAAGGSTSALRVEQPALIRTAEIGVRVDDVAGKASLAEGYARTAGGSVAGDDRAGSGDQARADLVLKVPPARLDGVLGQLSALGEETQRTSTTEDATEQVADVESRVATMQASIARVRAILSRADRIGDVVSVEGELSRRVTELEALQARQRALSGRVGMATITLHLFAERTESAAPPVQRGGFLGGLEEGWQAFTGTIGWLLLVLGAVLPFLLLLIPAALAARWALLRSRRPPAPTAPTATPAAAS